MKFIALFILMCIDVFTGVLCALISKSTKSHLGKLSSTAMQVGILKKVITWGAVVVAYYADRFLGTQYLCEAVTALLCISECISILENVNAAGIKIPDSLKKILEKGGEDNE